MQNKKQFKNKTLSALLATTTGLFGMHRFYLEGARGWRPWLYPAWFFGFGTVALNHLEAIYPDFPSDMSQVLHPLFFLAVVPAYVGFAESVAFALTPDARWDAHFNAGSPQKSRSGGLTIAIAVVALTAGLIALLSAIAILTEAWVSQSALPR